MLWRHLRNSQVEGVKFRRQQPVEEYIVDFLAFTPKLAVELDGGQHSDNQAYDEQRTGCLQRNGFMVLRFWNNEVFENIEGVHAVIRDYCQGQPPPPPSPLPRGEGACR